ncbi:MAG: DUF4349 domain-containing protein [Lachnospiraceae bacterium]|nr:DUF4349 domain-containing protein [Lachnospiraceae bacterium]
MKKRTFSFLLALMLTAALLTGCGGASPAAREETANYNFTDLHAVDGWAAKSENALAPDEQASEMPEKTDSTPSMPVSTDTTKFIYTGVIEAETKDLNAAVSGITDMVKSFGGWFEDSQVHEYKGGRSASLVARIPHNSFEEFMGAVASYDQCQVINKNASAENISEQYYDAESRLTTLRAKQKRLLELLEQAENVQDLLTVESELSEVEYQIDRFATRKNHYDSAIDYSTVRLSLREVTVLGTGTQPVTFWQRISKAFSDGVAAFGESLADFIVWFVGNLIFIVVFVVILLIVIAIIRRASRRGQKKREALAAAGYPPYNARPAAPAPQAPVQSEVPERKMSEEK